MRTFKTLLICTLMTISASVFSQENNSLLWKISGNGLESPSYLFGTIHVMCPDQLKLSPKVEEALEQTQQLALELDMDEPTFMHEMQQLSINSDRRNLSSLLSEEELNTLNSFFKENYQADMSQLGVLKPLILLSMMINKALECDQPGSYESILVSYASQENWEVLGLESLKDQFDVFNDVSEEEQLEWLLHYAGNLRKFKSDIKKLTEAYQQEKISAVLDLMTAYPEYKKIENALLYERNESWISRIKSLANETPTFFAVGTAHLPSERGVIELLRREGFVLTPIMNSPVN